jgi:hypothetical protein
VTPEEFEKEMDLISKGMFGEEDRYYRNDEGDKHIEADQLMCKLLRSLGYGSGVEIFENMPKWYA